MIEMQSVGDEMRELIRLQSWNQLRERLTDLHPSDVADLIIALPREEEGVAIAAGLELAGSRAVLIFQDNGIGNLLTALLTLSQPYHLPLFGIVTRRGGLGEYNSMIHTISERSEALLDAAGVRWFQLDTRTPLDRWAVEIERAWAFARTTHRPIFVLVNLMGG